jgi:hypothetical protein
VAEGGAPSYDPAARFVDVFGLDPATHPSTRTLRDALERDTGGGIGGARKQLARAATAALLNAAHAGVAYPLEADVDTEVGPAIVRSVQAVWDSGDELAILGLAIDLTELNRVGCPLLPVASPIDLADLAAEAAALAALPSGTCDAPISPWAYADPDDVIDVWHLLEENPAYAIGGATYVNDDGVCPAHTAPSTVEGDCTTTEGWMYVGSRHSSASSSGSSNDDFVEYGIAYQDGAGTWLGLGSGSSFGVSDPPDLPGDPYRYTRTWLDYRFGFAHEGAYDTGEHGTWIRDGFLTTTEGQPTEGEIYLLADGVDALPAGDMCVTYALEPVAACALEPVGTFGVSGAQELVVTFDGSVACDGCGMLTADGVPVGEVCL